MSSTVDTVSSSTLDEVTSVLEFVPTGPACVLGDRGTLVVKSDTAELTSIISLGLTLDVKLDTLCLTSLGLSSILLLSDPVPNLSWLLLTLFGCRS